MTQETKKLLDEEENLIKSLYVQGEISKKEKDFTALGFASCLIKLKMITLEESKSFITSVMNFY